MTTRTDRLERLATLARDLRTFQRTYFRTRDHRALVDAKRVEAAVDELLAELSPPDPPTGDNPSRGDTTP